MAENKNKEIHFFKKGYIHIYKGDGKGKTSILNGAVTRALGYPKMNVKYLRFLKNRELGEILFFERSINLKAENFYHFSKQFIWESKLENIADLVSEVSLKKHYFDKKIYARKGIEY